MQHSAGTVVFLTCVASGQSTDKVPTFEVADVRESKSTNPNPSKGGFSASGRVDLPNVTIKQLMMGAYGVQENMITGGPKWLDSDRFDIVAKGCSQHTARHAFPDAAITLGGALQTGDSPRRKADAGIRPGAWETRAEA